MAAAAMTIKTFPTDTFDREYPPDPPGRELDKYSRIWTVYRDERSKFELDIVDGWNKLFDIQLTFAGLFITALTVFLVDSYKMLQEDSTDFIADLLSNITASVPVVHATGNVTRSRSDSSHPSPSLDLRWTNGLWFSSLLITLTAALYCILAKQWIREYERIVRAGATTSHAWTVKQVMAWESMKRWGVPVLVSLLPILIHAALFLFVLGLCLFLIEIDTRVTILVAVAGGVVLLAYTVQTFISLLSDSCAWRTSLTRRLYDLFRYDAHAPSVFRRFYMALPWTGRKITDGNAEAYAIRWLFLSCGPDAAAVATQAIAAACGPPPKYDDGFVSAFHGQGNNAVPNHLWQMGRTAGLAAAAAPVVGQNAAHTVGAAALDAGWAGFISAVTAPGVHVASDNGDDVRAGHAAGRAARAAVQRTALHGIPWPQDPVYRMRAGRAAGYAGFQVGVVASSTVAAAGSTHYGAKDPRSAGYDKEFRAAYTSQTPSPPNDAEVLTYLYHYKQYELTERLRARIFEILEFLYPKHQPVKDEQEFCERALDGLERAY